MFLPVGTDAASGKIPWGTLLLIAANVGVAVLLGFPAGHGNATVNGLTLHLGGFNPLAWVTSAFVHFGYVHLIGNMVFLWVFGLVIEGLLGTGRFLLFYLFLAAVPSFVVQILYLAADRGQVAGASAAIFGLIGASALWAPRNKIHALFVWLWGGFVQEIEPTVFAMCGYYIGFEIILFLAGGGGLSSAMVHVLGAATGLVAGYLMLKKGLVDCEGWDYFSLKEHGTPGRDRFLAASVLGEDLVAQPPKISPLAEIRIALDEGNAIHADAIHRKQQQSVEGWALPREELEQLARLLSQSGSREAAIERMEEFIASHPGESMSMRLALARELLAVRRPQGAADLLRTIDESALTPEQRTLKRTLQEEARPRPGRLELE